MDWGRNILTEQEYEIKFKSKARMDGRGGVSTKPTTRKPGIIETIAEANLVIGSYNDGVVRILKDRKGSRTSLHAAASVDDVIEKASDIISQSVFGENILEMFSQGLSEQIQVAVNRKQYGAK